MPGTRDWSATEALKSWALDESGLEPYRTAHKSGSALRLVALGGRICLPQMVALPEQLVPASDVSR